MGLSSALAKLGAAPRALARLRIIATCDTLSFITTGGFKLPGTRATPTLRTRTLARSIGLPLMYGFETVCIAVSVVGLICGGLNWSLDEAMTGVVMGVVCYLRHLRQAKNFAEIGALRTGSYVNWDKYSMTQLGDIRWWNLIELAVLFAAAGSGLMNNAVEKIKEPLHLYRVPVVALLLALFLGTLIQDLLFDLGARDRDEREDDWKVAAYYYRDVARFSSPFGFVIDAVVVTSVVALAFNLLQRNIWDFVSLVPIGAIAGIHFFKVKPSIAVLKDLAKNAPQKERAGLAAEHLDSLKTWHLALVACVVVAITLQQVGSRFLCEISAEELAAMKKAAEKAAAGKKAAKSSKTAALERELTKEELDAQAAAEKKLVKEMAKLKMNREAKQERDLAKMELKARKREKKKEQDKWDAIKR